MSETILTSPAKPKIFVPGRPSLEPGVERYVLKGGGTAAFELEAGDRIQISALEGGQLVEVAAIGAKGKSDLEALGLNGRVKPVGIQRTLERDDEDAMRVRFGLYRRGLDLGRVKAARLLGPDAGAGEIVALQAERNVFAVFGAPAEPMVVWEQTPPSDVLIFILRATPRLMNTARLPDPLAEPRLDIRVNIASAESFEVYEGEYIQIIDVQGRQCSDFIAFNRKALDEGREQGLDSTTTRTMNGAAYPTPGLHSKFFDQDRNPLVEIGHSRDHRRRARGIRRLREDAPGRGPRIDLRIDQMGVEVDCACHLSGLADGLGRDPVLAPPSGGVSPWRAIPVAVRGSICGSLRRT